MKRGSVVESIHLSKPVTGQKILEAVGTIAEMDVRRVIKYVSTYGPGSRRKYEIGQACEYVCHDVRIMTPNGDDKQDFYLDEAYQDLFVMNWFFDGEKRGAGADVTDDTITEIVRSYRDRLAALLNDGNA